MPGHKSARYQQKSTDPLKSWAMGGGGQEFASDETYRLPNERQYTNTFTLFLWTVMLVYKIATADKKLSNA